jgi:hypothetical protein
MSQFKEGQLNGVNGEVKNGEVEVGAVESVDSTLSTPLSTPSQTELFETANACEQRIRRHGKEALEDARRAGEALNQAYDAHGRAGWKELVKESFVGSYESSSVYRRIAKFWDRVKDRDSIDAALTYMRERGMTLWKPETAFVSTGDMQKAWDTTEEGDWCPPGGIPGVKRKLAALTKGEECRGSLREQFNDWLNNLDKYVLRYLGHEDLGGSIFFRLLGDLQRNAFPVAKVVVCAHTARERMLREGLSKEEADQAFRQAIEDGMAVDELEPPFMENVEGILKGDDDLDNFEDEEEEADEEADDDEVVEEEVEEEEEETEEEVAACGEDD